MLMGKFKFYLIVKRSLFIVNKNLVKVPTMHDTSQRAAKKEIDIARGSSLKE